MDSECPAPLSITAPAISAALKAYVWALLPTPSKKRLVGASSSRRAQAAEEGTTKTSARAWMLRRRATATREQIVSVGRSFTGSRLAPPRAEARQKVGESGPAAPLASLDGPEAVQTRGVSKIQRGGEPCHRHAHVSLHGASPGLQLYCVCMQSSNPSWSTWPKGATSSPWAWPAGWHRCIWSAEEGKEANRGPQPRAW